MNGFLATLNSFGKKLARRIERARLRRQLLEKNDRVLADIGISRELLLEGVRAWPSFGPGPDALPRNR